LISLAKNEKEQGSRVNQLLRNAGWTALATVVAGLLCLVVGVSVAGAGGAWSAVMAAAVSLPVGVVVLVVFWRLGVSPEAIVFGSFLRAGLTLGGVVLAAELVEGLRLPVLFLSVGVIYLVNLAVETWLVSCGDQRFGGASPAS
jgi:hypothetical protein